MDRYPLLSTRNLKAYVLVMLLWAGVSLILTVVLTRFTDRALDPTAAFVFCTVSVLLGMAIMFGASVHNVRKLRPGFARLAAGECDPQIPPVWCPVLTMATRAAVDLSRNLHVQHRKDIVR